MNETALFPLAGFHALPGCHCVTASIHKICDFHHYDISEEMLLGTKTGRSTSSLVPQINPVFLINGWTAPGARVFVDGRPWPAERYATQVSGHDLTVWVEGRFEQKTQFKIVA